APRLRPPSKNRVRLPRKSLVTFSRWPVARLMFRPPQERSTAAHPIRARQPVKCTLARGRCTRRASGLLPRSGFFSTTFGGLGEAIEGLCAAHFAEPLAICSYQGYIGPREAASCVRSHISPGPYRSFRELSLTGSVDPDIWCPPTFVGNSGIERSNGDRGFALSLFANCVFEPRRITRQPVMPPACGISST